jgi:tRNA pseudouridine55 synthase
MADGLLILDKPSGPTSHDMVSLVRRGTGEKRVGHAGTLDPLATGVLVICLGAATRLSEYLIGEDKRYRAVARLGVATTTYDSQGEVTATAALPPGLGRESIERALAAFRGEIMQAPPAFSAIKRGGRKAYELARRGEAVTIEPRAVTIHELRLEDWQPPDVTLDVRCSAGTYIRSLAHDLGQALGCGAHLTALRRTAAGSFTVEQAVSWDDLQAAFAGGTWTSHLRSPQAALADWPVIRVERQAAERLAHGNPVADGDCQAGEALAPDGPKRALALDSNGTLLAVVERDQAAGAWRPKKVLVSSN